MLLLAQLLEAQREQNRLVAASAVRQGGDTGVQAAIYNAVKDARRQRSKGVQGL